MARTDLDARYAFFSWTTLMDAGLLLGIAWTVPFAALAVGVPIALAVALLVWIVRMTIGAF